MPRKRWTIAKIEAAAIAKREEEARLELSGENFHPLCTSTDTLVIIDGNRAYLPVIRTRWKFEKGRKVDEVEPTLARDLRPFVQHNDDCAVCTCAALDVFNATYPQQTLPGDVAALTLCTLCRFGLVDELAVLLKSVNFRDIESVTYDGPTKVELGIMMIRESTWPQGPSLSTSESREMIGAFTTARDTPYEVECLYNECSCYFDRDGKWSLQPLSLSSVLDCFNEWEKYGGDWAHDHYGLSDETSASDENEMSESLVDGMTRVVDFFVKYCVNPTLIMPMHEPYGHDDDLDFVFVLGGHLKRQPQSAIFATFRFGAWI